MKINSELERLLLAQQQALAVGQTQNAQTARAKSADSSIAFDDVLNQAFQKTDAASLEENSSLALTTQNTRAQMQELFGLGAGEATQATEEIDEISAQNTYTVDTLMSDIENILSGLDTYSQSLRNIDNSNNGSASLKQAWQNLQTFSQSVNGLRQNYTNLSQSNAFTQANPSLMGLDSMINDLEIMAVTETYKLNRGDYA